MCPESESIDTLPRARRAKLTTATSLFAECLHKRVFAPILPGFVALSLCMGCIGGAARADDVLDFLEARGLDSLAALRVEELASKASPEDRAQLLDRLAEIFARVLDTTEDQATQERLLARADALVEDLATAKGDALRVSAARTRYRDAARLAEGIRAGIPGDATAASATLSAQAAALLEVAKRAEKRAADIDKRAERASGLARDLAVDALNEERSMAGQARYLAAWSLLYRGFLAKSQEDTTRARTIFGDLLGASEGKLAPDDISADLRSDEAFASAILGYALATARVQGFAESSNYLKLLESDGTHPSIGEALPGWKLIAALEARSFSDARKFFARVAPREDAANWARVAVSRAVEDGDAANSSNGAKDAAVLLNEAVATLAARRDLSAIRDLVGRYGEGILGTDAAGFVPRYVRAVRLYDEAQSAIAKAGDDEDKLTSAEVRGPSQEAADALGAALEAADVKQYEDAAQSCRLMRAWSLRGAGRFADGAQAFDEVAAASLGERAEDAARAAIACIDDQHRQTTDVASRDAAEKELIARIDAYLSRFPASDAVPSLLVRKIALVADPASGDIERLLQVRPDTKEWLPSRRQALSALYRAFRAGKEPREETGKRYLQILGELPADPKTQLPASSPAIARQALEVVLANEVRDLKTAMSLIAALEAAGAAGEFDLRAADEEIAYRKLQLAILSERWADVEAALAPFEKPEATELWADAALRLAIRGAEGKRRSTPSDSPARAGYVATIVRAGDAILLRAGGPAVALADTTKDSQAYAQLARVALDARVELVKSSADADSAKAGLPIAEALLAKTPRDATILRAAAGLAEAAGNYEDAANHLRALVGGLPARTNPWFEAKVDQMRVLAKLDPVRARTVIDQYRTLYPDLGPEPWRTRIAEIDATVPKSSGGSRTTAPDATDAPQSDADDSASGAGSAGTAKGVTP
jgi:hypothetical protein